MTASSGLKILIADDFPPIRERLSSLIREGYPSVIIDEAADTDGLIQKALTEEWDLIISDISMPGAGGVKALRRIKKIKPSLPVLVISTHAYMPYAKEILSAGATGYLTKDDIPLNILNVVEQILFPV
ncbi:MAG: response regulator transcription factor [Chitinophagaceae bacterium]|nr:response regulator transcription factor [Chitinophagaceae bacterium]